MVSLCKLFRNYWKQFEFANDGYSIWGPNWIGQYLISYLKVSNVCTPKPLNIPYTFSALCLIWGIEKKGMFRTANFGGPPSLQILSLLCSQFKPVFKPIKRAAFLTISDNCSLAGLAGCLAGCLNSLPVLTRPWCSYACTLSGNTVCVFSPLMQHTISLTAVATRLWPWGQKCLFMSKEPQGWQFIFRSYAVFGSSVLRQRAPHQAPLRILVNSPWWCSGFGVVLLRRGHAV